MEDLWQVHDSGRCYAMVGCAFSRPCVRSTFLCASWSNGLFIRPVRPRRHLVRTRWKREDAGVPAHLPFSDAGAGRLPFARGFLLPKPEQSLSLSGLYPRWAPTEYWVANDLTFCDRDSRHSYLFDANGR